MRRSPRRAVAGAVAAIALLIVPATTIAQHHGRHGYHGDDRGRWNGDRGDDRGDGGWGRAYGRGGGDRRDDGDREGPRGRDGYRGGYGYGGPRGGHRHRCRDSGAGGTIIGAIAGGLLGNSIAGSGDRGVGTILGAGGGALAGRALDRDC